MLVIKCTADGATDLRTHSHAQRIITIQNNNNVLHIISIKISVLINTLFLGSVWKDSNSWFLNCSGKRFQDLNTHIHFSLIILQQNCYQILVKVPLVCTLLRIIIMFMFIITIFSCYLKKNIYFFKVLFIIKFHK